jgi:hypothetical protein
LAVIAYCPNVMPAAQVRLRGDQPEHVRERAQIARPRTENTSPIGTVVHFADGRNRRSVVENRVEPGAAQTVRRDRHGARQRVQRMTLDRTADAVERERSVQAAGRGERHVARIAVVQSEVRVAEERGHRRDR